MQFGQAPSSPPLLASAVESRDSPVPWPYWTSSYGSLSSSMKSQPTMSSTKPLPSASVPSLNAISTSCGSSMSAGPTPRGWPLAARASGAISTRESHA